MSRVLLALAGLILIPTAPTPASAEDGWAALDRPGVAVVMRHALAPGTGDPPEFELGDCSTQRNLNDAGRAQARAIGEALRARGFTPDRVLTSRWCRSAETADQLGFGEAERFPPLDSFFRNRARREPQTRALRNFLADLPEDEEVVMVTHQVNITALTGVFPSSGEAVMIEVNDAGEVEVLGTALVAP
jgi:phosphohistidine phosphatase SixA